MNRLNVWSWLKRNDIITVFDWPTTSHISREKFGAVMTLDCSLGNRWKAWPHSGALLRTHNFICETEISH